MALPNAEPELFRELSALLTEQNNPATWDIDLADTEQILRLINAEDSKVAAAVGGTPSLPKPSRQSWMPSAVAGASSTSVLARAGA